MKKNDLKSGDIVGFRNNEKGIVLLKANNITEVQDIIVDLDSGVTIELDKYNDDLKYEFNVKYDIMSICAHSQAVDNLIEHNLISFLSHAPGWKKWTWYRKEKMTLSEIEKELGYKVEIIDK